MRTPMRAAKKRTPAHADHVDSDLGPIRPSAQTGIRALLQNDSRFAFMGRRRSSKVQRDRHRLVVSFNWHEEHSSLNPTA